MIRIEVEGPGVGSSRRRLSPDEFWALVKYYPRHGTGKDAASFEQVMGYSWDACLVFGKDRGKAVVERYVRKLARGGVEYAVVRPQGSRREALVLIRAGVSRLAKMADALDWPMRLDPKEAEIRMKRGDASRHIRPVTIRHDPVATKGATPYENVFGKYDTERSLQALYAVETGPHIFGASALRLKLLNAILRSKIHGCGLKLDAAVRSGELKAAFPLHAAAERDALIKAWTFFPPSKKKHPVLEEEEEEERDDPFEAVRRYLGERVAMYFRFLAHFAGWTRVSAVVGVLAAVACLTEISVLGRSRRESRTLPFFASFQLVWAVAMLERWKQVETRTAQKWGMLGIEACLPDRPDFKGSKRASLVNGKMELYFPESKRSRLLTESIVIVLALILFVAGVAVFTLWVRIELADTLNDRTLAAVLSALVSSALVESMNQVYTRIAKALNQRENHRTDEQFVNALALKLIAFFLINYNFTLFYMAFFQRHVEGCPRKKHPRNTRSETGTCYSLLELNLLILFLTKTASNWSADVFQPLLCSAYRREKYRRRDNEKPADRKKRCRANLCCEPSIDPATARIVNRHGPNSSFQSPMKDTYAEAAVAQYVLDDADALADAIEDYTQLAVRFAFATLFVVAFPALPAMVWIANLVEGHADLRKFCLIKKREWPSDTSSIGSWQSVFETITLIAVVTNTMVIFYTVRWNPFRTPLSTQQRAFIAFVYQYVLFSLIFVVRMAVPDVPHEVTIQLQRQAFLAAKLIDRQPDEESDSDIDDHQQGLDDDDDQFFDHHPPSTTTPGPTVRPSSGQKKPDDDDDADDAPSNEEDDESSSLEEDAFCEEALDAILQSPHHDDLEEQQPVYHPAHLGSVAFVSQQGPSRVRRDLDDFLDQRSGIVDTTEL